MAIHKTAIIADDAIVPASCEIGPNVVIGEGVVLGENVKIMANAYLEQNNIKAGIKITVTKNIPSNAINVSLIQSKNHGYPAINV